LRQKSGRVRLAPYPMSDNRYYVKYDVGPPNTCPEAPVDALNSNNYFDALPGAPGEQSFVQGREFPPMMRGQCKQICVGDLLLADDATSQIHQSVD
jgi:hypothetical protein